MASQYFEGKNILLISPEAWSHLFVSKHHYAIELSKRNAVYFLNPPTSIFSLEKTEYRNLNVIKYTPFIKGLRFLPSFLQRYLMKLKFNELQKLASAKFDCVWSFDNSVFFDFSFLPKNVLKISHIVDYSQNFQFSTAAATADSCFGVSQNIVDKFLTFNKNSFLVPHGVSLDREEVIEVTLPGSNSIKAMYVGNLDSRYLDKACLFSMIENHHDIDFIFLGSGGKNWMKHSNTFMLGVVKPERLLSYFKKADVLLLVYDVEKFPNQLTNAHKILEYLASGKVIVSTLMSDYADKSYLLEMSDKENLSNLLKKVVTTLELYNSVEKRSVRVKYAANNSYSMRLQEIQKIIAQSTSTSV